MVVVLAGSHCGTHTCACRGFPFLILLLAHILVTVLVGFAHTFVVLICQTMVW